jgi:hypothetical protein
MHGVETSLNTNEEWSKNKSQLLDNRENGD